jgi:hypothetical protein
MIKNTHALNIIGILSVLLLVGGTSATTTLLNTTHAQTATLGEPYFVEKGK